jgi:ketosteroid isomerase-like protein
LPSKLELLEQTLEEGFPLGEDVPTALADPKRERRLREVLGEVTAESFVVEMVGDQHFRIERNGIDGFLEAWHDWAEAFAQFRVEVDDVVESGPHLITLVRQIGLPRGGTSEIENESAALWTFEGDKVTRVEFHLDPSAALRAAGLED